MAGSRAGGASGWFVSAWSFWEAGLGFGASRGSRGGGGGGGGRVGGGGGRAPPAPGQEDLDLVLPQARVSSAEAHDLAFDGGSRFMGRAVVAAAGPQGRPPPPPVAPGPAGGRPGGGGSRRCVRGKSPGA